MHKQFHKRRLASSYLDLLKKLDSDVKKLIREGIATKAEGLHVAVKVNEAEMTLAQVEDGLSLSRMLLCQLCGWPLDKPMTLAEENVDLISIPISETSGYTVSTAETTRPELRMLQNAVDISRQQTRLLKAGNLPKMALVGGDSVSNPNNDELNNLLTTIKNQGDEIEMKDKEITRLKTKLAKVEASEEKKPAKAAKAAPRKRACKKTAATEE